MDEKNILCAEILLSKYFCDHMAQDRIPAKSILAEIKEQFSGLHRPEIKEARKRLNIRSKQIDGEYLWEWENPVLPKDIWTLKSNELLEGRDERKRYREDIGE